MNLSIIIRNTKEVDTHTNFHLYHYAGNNPVKYVDPDGKMDFLKDSGTGFSLWFNAIKNAGDISSANKVSEFMNKTPEFWGVLAATGVVAFAGYEIYSSVPSVKDFFNSEMNWIMEQNQNLLDSGIDLANLTYSYNSNDITKFSTSFKGSSFSNLKTDVLFQRVFHKLNDERGNFFELNLKLNVSENTFNNEISFSVSFLFNAKYREKSYEEFISNTSF